MLLPFALAPLIKFCYSSEIIDEFVISQCQFVCATAFGALLYFTNFFVVFTSVTLNVWWHWVLLIIGSLIYIGLILIIIIEPIKPLRKMTKAEINDHEYEQLIVEETDRKDTSVT